MPCLQKTNLKKAIRSQRQQNDNLQQENHRLAAELRLAQRRLQRHQRQVTQFERVAELLRDDNRALVTEAWQGAKKVNQLIRWIGREDETAGQVARTYGVLGRDWRGVASEWEARGQVLRERFREGGRDLAGSEESEGGGDVEMVRGGEEEVVIKEERMHEDEDEEEEESEDEAEEEEEELRLPSLVRDEPASEVESPGWEENPVEQVMGWRPEWWVDDEGNPVSFADPHDELVWVPHEWLEEVKDEEQL